MLHTFAAGNPFAIRREDRGDAYDVTCRDARVAECKLKTGKPFTMFTDAFGEKYFLSDERHGAGVRCLRGDMTCEILCCGKVTRRFCSVKLF